jgi:hypothetical protein
MKSRKLDKELEEQIREIVKQEIKKYEARTQELAREEVIKEDRERLS